MGRPVKPIELTPEQNARLRAMEHDPNLPPQTRTRAPVVRRAAQGIPRAPIAASVGDHPYTIQRILRRFRQYGVSGRHERPRLGRPPKWTPHATACVQTGFALPRTWTCTQLRHALADALGVQVGRETMRLRLQQLGYRWQRTRYVPAQSPDPLTEAVFAGVMDALKRGGAQGR